MILVSPFLLRIFYDCLPHGLTRKGMLYGICCQVGATLLLQSVLESAGLGFSNCASCLGLV